MKITVSIITPNYNGSKFIEETMDSVLAQTFQDWEMLIIDDGSTDNSNEIIKKYIQKDQRIKIFKTNTNKFPKVTMEPGAARNTATDLAQGRYIAFLDSDDLWEPEKLEKQINFLKNNDYPFSYTWYKIINEEGQFIGNHTPKHKELSYKDLLKNCPIGCLTVMYDTHKIGKQFIGINKYARGSDYLLWLHIMKQGYSAHCLQEELSRYRLVNGSISSNKFKALKHHWTILTESEKLNFFTACYNFSFYLYNGIVKKSKYMLIRLFKNTKN